MERVSNDRNRCNNLAKDESSTNIAQKVGSGLGHSKLFGLDILCFHSPIERMSSVTSRVAHCHYALN